MPAKLRKGDEVIVLAGKDKGKTGKIVKMIPKTVTAETAATPRAKFLFFSIFFSSFKRDIRSVTLTFP